MRLSMFALLDILMRGIGDLQFAADTCFRSWLSNRLAEMQYARNSAWAV